MSDMTEKFAEIQRAWVAQQQEMLDSWLGTLKGSRQDSLRAGWRKAAEVMEAQVNSALAAQTESLMACVASMENLEGTPEPVAQAVEQLKSTVESWTGMQREIWHIWFDMLRKSAPPPETPAEAVLESWEELVRHTMSIQEKWLPK